MFISAVFGTFEYYKDLGRIRSFAKLLKPVDLKTILAGLIWGSLIISFIIFLLVYFKVSVNRELVIFLFSITSISTFALIFIDLKIFEKINNHWKIYTSIFGLLVFAITLLVNVIVDAEIVKLTEVNANLFPSAQKYILLLFAPLFWLFALVYASFFIYIYYAVILILRMLKEVKYINGIIDTLCILSRRKRNQRKFELFHDAAIFAGLGVFVITYSQLGLSVANSDSYKKKISELLVFSSFHLDGKGICKNIDDEKIKIAFLKGDSISAVKVDEDDKYHFFVDKCIRYSQKI